MNSKDNFWHIIAILSLIGLIFFQNMIISKKMANLARRVDVLQRVLEEGICE